MEYFNAEQFTRMLRESIMHPGQRVSASPGLSEANQVFDEMRFVFDPGLDDPLSELCLVRIQLWLAFQRALRQTPELDGLAAPCPTAFAVAVLDASDTP